MKYCVILLTMIWLAGCTPPDKPKVELAESTNNLPDSLLIKPGESIGNIKLRSDMEKLTTQYGKPDESDAAMGSVAYTWYIRHDTAAYRTSVYGHRNFGAADEDVLHIKKVLVTSPLYVTSDGIHTGTDKDSLGLFYQLADSSRHSVKGRAVNLFADINKGIAFDVDVLTNKCIGISIFKPGDISAANINLY